MSVRPDCWAGPRHDEILWMEDAAQAVIFDRRSRQTHLLNPIGAAALRLFMNGPLDAVELGRRIASLSSAVDGSGGDGAAEILQTFDALGLIEPAEQ